MEQLDFTNIPYSQHHREAAMMLGSATIQSVFTYLLDEYLFRLRTGKPTAMKLSKQGISMSCQMNRRTVNNAIDSLATMKLIHIDESNISINGDIYMSLIYSFHKLQKEKRDDFIQFLADGDYDNLQKLGYVFLPNSSNALSEMTGGLCRNTHLDSQDSEGCAEIHSSVQKYTVGGKSCAEIHTVDNENVQKCTPAKDSNCAFLHTTVQKCTQIVEEILDGSDKKCAFLHSFDDFEDEEAKNALADVIFDKKDTLSEENWVCIFTHLLRKNLCISAHKGVHFYTPEINKINNKKINQDFSSFQDVSEGLEQDESSNNDDEDIPDNLPKLNKGGYHRRPSYPYFPASEVLEFINDIHLCLDNDIKLFLYHVNQEIHARYDQDEEYDDETGEVIKEASVIDTTQLVLRKSEVEDIASEAITNARNDIEDRDIFVNDEEVHITAEDNLDRLLKVNIIDWNFQLIGDGEKACQIDWGRIQNPDGEELQPVKEPTSHKRTKEGEVNVERENNIKYISAIIDWASEDETWDKMSPMEKLIYNFLCEYFVFKDDCNEVEDVGKLGYLNRNVLLKFFLTEKQKYPDTPSQEEFFATFNVDKPDTYGGISLRTRMFSAAKIQYWNKKHGFKSLI